MAAQAPSRSSRSKIPGNRLVETPYAGFLFRCYSRPYLYLLMLGFIVCQIARVALHSYLIPKRLEKLRRELDGIKHLPDGEHQVAFVKIMARHRKQGR
jgi:hypothetical protein